MSTAGAAAVPGCRASEDAGPDAAAVVAAARAVGGLMRSHGGSVEVREVSPEGAVRVAFRGGCASCWTRPACLAATVRPVLLGVPGVRTVDADGVRLSRAAQERLAGCLGPGYRAPEAG